MTHFADDAFNYSVIEPVVRAPESDVIVEQITQPSGVVVTTVVRELPPKVIKHHQHDIRKSNVPDSQIADTPLHLVYQWMRTGAWRPKDFQRWCQILRITE